MHTVKLRDVDGVENEVTISDVQMNWLRQAVHNAGGRLDVVASMKIDDIGRYMAVRSCPICCHCALCVRQGKDDAIVHFTDDEFWCKHRLEEAPMIEGDGGATFSPGVHEMTDDEVVVHEARRLYNDEIDVEKFIQKLKVIGDRAWGSSQ